MPPETPTTPNPENVPPSAQLAPSPTIPVSVPSIATTGTRQAFRDIQRQLSEQDLASSGVQKLLLADLERVDSEKEVLEGYRERYFQADRRAAIFEERLNSVKSADVMFAVGLTLGGVCVGLGPAFWNAGSLGVIIVVIGGILVVGSGVARVIRR